MRGVAVNDNRLVINETDRPEFSSFRVFHQKASTGHHRLQTDSAGVTGKLPIESSPATSRTNSSGCRTDPARFKCLYWHLLLPLFDGHELRRRDFLSALAVGQYLGSSFGGRRTADDVEELRGRIGADGESPDWDAFRREFDLDPELVYLNTGSIGCTPRIILEQIHRAASAMERNPYHHLWGNGLAGDLQLVCEQVAGLFGAPADTIALTENTTSGLFAIASGIQWKAGDQVVLTNHEHLSCMAVWKYLQKQFELELRYVEIPLPDFSETEFLTRLQGQLTDRTVACCLSHVDSMTGIELPIAEVAKITRAHRVLLLCDAAQSLGMLPVNIPELGVDALAASGHKWLLGPKGTGLIYVDRNARDRIRPQITDWSFAALTPATGTRNIAHLLGWAIVAELQTMLKPGRIAAKISQLANELHKQLEGQRGLQPLLMSGRSAGSGMFSFRLESKLDSLKIARRLSDEFGVMVKPLPATYELANSADLEPIDYHAIRFSTHIYLGEQDFAKVIEAFRVVLSS